MPDNGIPGSAFTPSGAPVGWGKGYGRLAGRHALVTGSTRGLGRTVAEWLAREGANIIVSGREQPAVDASVAAIREIGVEAWGVPADLASVADTHRLAETTLGLVPQLDILVNNAGMSISQHFIDVSDDQFEEQLNVNLRSPFILAQHIGRHMRDHAIRGRIVNVSTIGVFMGHQDKMVYNMAKAGVQAMTRNMSYELGHTGITVNCVAPGAVTDRPGVDDEAPPEHRQRWNEAIPMGRLGRAEDIAAAVLFFCLPETEWTTGQTLLTDGGHLSVLS